MCLQHAAIHNADNLMEQADMPTYSELLAALAEAKKWADQRCDGAAANAVQRLYAKHPELAAISA